jgi:UDP-N-acetyl-D-mannosaminuronic acid dehydrogenase
MMRDRKICIMGLGYVGLTLAVVMAEVGFDVQGVEIRDDVVRDLARGKPHFHEPGLAGRLARVLKSGRLSVSQHIPADFDASVYVVTVGTPLDGAGKVRVDMVVNVVREIAEHLKDRDMVVMRSTVELGTTRNVVKPLLDATGQSFDLVFCPERTLEGQALRELVDNAQRDVHFGLSNEVARLADAIGVSAMEVIRAGKLGYPRTDLPVPGPVGGPCLEKDSHILASGLGGLGIAPEIIMAARRTNERQPGEVIAQLHGLCCRFDNFPDAPVITLAGVAFKGRPETDDLRGTMARPILAALRAAFPLGRFRGFDIAVEATTIRKTFQIEAAQSIDDAFAGSNLLIIANNHPCFERMPLSSLAEQMARPAIIFDFWNNFAAGTIDVPEGVAYTGLGELGRMMKQWGTRS